MVSTVLLDGTTVCADTVSELALRTQQYVDFQAQPCCQDCGLAYLECDCWPVYEGIGLVEYLLAELDSLVQQLTQYLNRAQQLRGSVQSQGSETL
jgi:hypothetical protein